MRTLRPATGFILVTLLLDAVGFGLIIPVLPKLVEGFTGGGASAASHAYGLLLAVYSLMLFITAPALGALSDRVGRRPIILVTLVGAAVDYALMAIAPALWVLFVGRVVAGVCGANFTTANAYIADITPPERRAERFGLTGAAFGIGFVLGPALGGALGSLGPRVPFWVAGALTLLNALYGWLVLPESLPRERRRAFRWAATNPFTGLARLAAFRDAVPLALVFLAIQLAGQVMPATWALFVEHRFAWRPGDIGASLAFVGVCIAICQGGLTRVAVTALGERGVVAAGLIVCVVAFVLFGIATSGWMLYPLMALYALGCTVAPAAQALVSATAPADRQGELQGTLTGLMGVGAVLGPLIATAAFAWGTRRGGMALPGAAFFTGAALYALALGIALMAIWRRRSIPAV